MAKKRKPAPEKAADSEAVSADDETDDAPKKDAKKSGDKSGDKSSDDDDDTHSEALKLYQDWFNHDRENMDAAYEDLRFVADVDGSLGTQWDAQARALREDRPCLVVNKTGQFVRQVTGDIRQMRPAIKCVPVDEAANQEVAEKALPRLLRYIENRSDAQGAYFAAMDTQVAAGIGHVRVLTEYASERTFNQEIRIQAIKDGIAVVWDSDAELPDRSDAMGCFVPVDMTATTFKKQYPDASPDPLPTVPQFFNDWYGDNRVRIAEYWRKVRCKRLLAILPDGGIDDLTDAEPEERAAAKQAGATLEKRDGYRVERYLITASEIIEGPTEWKGPDIPIVPFIGEELTIGRRTIRRGLVRALKDIQRVYNYAISADAEVVALQPKAPFVGTRKNFEKNIDEWETANSKNWPFLPYEPDSGNGGKAPQREAPPAGSPGLQSLMELASADMNAVTGIYPASLGAHSNETSGKAIMARQREGDTGTFVYSDNFARGVRRVGQVVINLVQHVYDTQRELRIIGEDGKPDSLHLNQATLDPRDGMAEITLNDVTKGAYDVVIEMGPSYSTKREEAREGMQTMMQALGPQGVMIGDIFAKQQDWPLADQVAKRLKFLLPPAVQQAEAREANEPPPPQLPPPPPSPEQQMALQKHQADMAKMQTDQANAQQEHQFNGQRLQLDAGKLQFEQNKHQSEIQIRMREIDAELEKARLDHHATMAGHAAAIDSANATASASAPSPDPRVDELQQAVSDLRDVVKVLAQAVTSQQPPDEGAPPQGGPPGGLPPMRGPPGPPPVNPNQPPPGGFSMPGQPPQGAVPIQ